MVIGYSFIKNGIDYGKWTHIDGWSEAVVDFIYVNEGVNSLQNVPNPQLSTITNSQNQNNNEDEE
jgi:hypothetical protein